MGFDADKIIPPGANIKVIGVGGGGGNAVNTMIRSGLDGVEFIAANTDVQALRFALPEKKIQIGKELTKGLGAGADPDVGRDAALEDRHEITEALAGADMVFITAGMGGGTGTGGASVIAQIARELGALTVAVVTKPFNFEGKRRKKHGEMGIERLRESVDTLISIPNQRLLQIATPDLSMVDAFRMADEVLVNAVKGISDIINIPGTVNVDFADVKTVMSSMGLALMGIGRASGQNRAVEAAKQAICSPLLEDIDIEGATGILINITASSNLSLMEVNEACSIIQDAAHEDANIIFGAVIDESCGDEIRVTVIATGFPAEYEEQDSSNEHSAFGQKPRASSIIRQSYASGRFDTSGRITVPTSKPIVVPHNPFTQPIRKEPEEKKEQPTLHKPAPLAHEAKAESFIAPAATAATVAAAAAPSVSFAVEAEDLTKLTMNNDILPFDEHLDEIEHPVPVSSAMHKPIEGATSEGAQIPVVEAAAPAAAAPAVEEEAVVEEPVQEAQSQDIFAEEEPALASNELDEVHDDVLERSLEATEPAPMDSLFQASDDAEADDMTSFDRKIDEAIKLADKLKSSGKTLPEDDELDIPAFLRGGMNDLSLD